MTKKGVPLEEEGAHEFDADADAEAVVPAVDGLAEDAPVAALTACEGEASPAADAEIEAHVDIRLGLDEVDVEAQGDGEVVGGDAAVVVGGAGEPGILQVGVEVEAACDVEAGTEG